MATFESVHDERVGVLEGSGYVVEGIGGIGAVVLAIIALTGTLALEFAAIAAIAIGVALIAEGGTITTRLWRFLSAAGEERKVAELGGGMSAELLGGVTGSLLGLLALLHIAPTVLVPVAAIVLGAAVLLGTGAMSEASAFTLGHTGRADVVARETIFAAAGAQMMVGIGAVVLGIVAIVGTHPVLLSLVAFLALGAWLVLGGTAVGGAVMAEFRR
jgi:hypothetical protein